jgi:polyhydroxybutyrate depolymerase
MKLPMSLRMLCFLAMGAVGAACGASAAPAAQSPVTGVQHLAMDVGGHQRTYRLFTPSLNAGKTMPLLVLMHGCGPAENGESFASSTGFDQKATANGFIAVYPDGDGGCWNSGLCCGQADDVAFTSHLLDRLGNTLPIDRTRIFVVGYSGGASMALRVGCQLARRIAGVVSVSGAMVFSDCRPARPVPMMEVHGTADDTAPLMGGVFGMPTPAVGAFVQDWARLDGCTGGPVDTKNGITTTSQWAQCKSKAVVRLDTVEGGHHTWFGSTIDPIPGEPNATDLSWTFLNSLAVTQ